MKIAAFLAAAGLVPLGAYGYIQDVDVACVYEDHWAPGNGISGGYTQATIVASTSECQLLCQQYDECDIWTTTSANECFLKTGASWSTLASKAGSTTGPKYCAGCHTRQTDGEFIYYLPATSMIQAHMEGAGRYGNCLNDAASVWDRQERFFGFKLNKYDMSFSIWDHSEAAMTEGTGTLSMFYVQNCRGTYNTDTQISLDLSDTPFQVQDFTGLMQGFGYLPGKSVTCDANGQDCTLRCGGAAGGCSMSKSRPNLHVLDYNAARDQGCFPAPPAVPSGNGANILLGKPVSASTTYPNADWAPAGLVDGDYNKGSHTAGGGGETNPWLSVDLGVNPPNVGTVRLLNRVSKCASRLFTGTDCDWFFSDTVFADNGSSGARILLSDSPCSGDSCPGATQCGFIGTPSESQWYEVSCYGHTGRYLTVLLPGAGRLLNVFEMEAYAETSAPTAAPTTFASAMDVDADGFSKLFIFGLDGDVAVKCDADKADICMKSTSADRSNWDFISKEDPHVANAVLVEEGASATTSDGTFTVVDMMTLRFVDNSEIPLTLEWPATCNCDGGV